MAALVDTNILVYRFDPRFPDKQRVATARWDRERSAPAGPSSRRGARRHRSKPLRGGGPLLDLAEATQEAEELLTQFDVLYPNEAIVRLALRAAAAYQLSWFDAHLWAYAEHYGLGELISEDFQHDRIYGTVRVVNPFAAVQ